ncbi:glycine--tRNA ligase subunit alpha [Candidatus Gromoviella agglomerans]|uniref:glycine--tRNA ligase subunit alpha n=1 Tax=Candidatus Gromoviella agglomerans TaxID=2806609 RepID=UPI001E44825D|nr:glycine--tRNA ligase subunit alpha [Candidatus Gromoviella agglomerans]
MNIEDIILNLQQFWKDYGCTILPQYDMEMGAGTFHPETFFRSITKSKWNCAFIQVCRRPFDGRYGENPNRLQKFHQFQVTLKPSPLHAQELALKSLEKIGITPDENEIRFLEDNWESPTLGASGIGWEVQYNGMEILQFTYFQQFASVQCNPITVEITYGIERLAMCVQNCQNTYDLIWSDDVKYRDLFYIQEKECSEFNFNEAATDIISRQFFESLLECRRLIDKGLILPAYEYCIKSSHLFNLMEARGVISTSERCNNILKIRELASLCAHRYLENNQEHSLRFSLGDL